MINRTLEQEITNNLQNGKVVLLFGARRVGKTVLMEQIVKKYGGKVTVLNGEDYATKQLLSNQTISHYQHFLSGTDLLVIDEAQNIENIGQVLKLMVDHVKNVSFLVSGSSAFDLLNKAGEPLVGRAFTYHLFPFSMQELSQKKNTIELTFSLEESLIYGNYPELVYIREYQKKQRYLQDMVNAYLLKDILSIDGIKNSAVMLNLLRLLAFQIGSLCSLDELSKQLSISRNTVEKYIDLLTKIFVIYQLAAFSNNARKEIKKSNKYYFYDNGIRNALIGDFRPLVLRQDAGALFENFILSERIKNHNNNGNFVRYYFWRNYEQNEVDLIEENNGEISAFECKWNPRKEKSAPKSFTKLYPNAKFQCITNENWLDMLK